MPNRITGAIESVTSPERGAVIQRDGATGSITIRLNVNSPGMLRARIREGRTVLDGFQWRDIVEVRPGENEVELPEVPVGGEYTLELRVQGDGRKTLGEATIGHLLIGDIWVTGGQSNMDGCGKLVNIEPPSKQVHAFYYDDRWDTAIDPLCWYNEAVDSVHWAIDDPAHRDEAARRDRKFRRQGAGPAVAFGKALVNETGVPVGLVVCSHGGTSMTQWSPEKRDEGGASLYGSMMRRIAAVGGKIAGIIWYQGESDAIGQEQALYSERTRSFVSSVRNDVGDPDLPFLYVQLAPFYTGHEVELHWKTLQSDQLELEKSLGRAAMTSAIDAGLDDAIHIDTASARQLGRRLAHLALIVAHGRDDLQIGPRPVSARFADRDRMVLHVTFSDVNGGLRPKRDIQGFWVRKDDTDIAIALQEVHSEDPCVVVLTFEEPVPHLSELWYGWGINPVVNLTDKADMAVPAFGPVSI